MDVAAAGMDGPHLRFAAATRRDGGTGMVLLHPHIANGVAGTPQGSQQLMAVVLQGLQPGARGGAHGEQAALKLQGPAMGGQQRASDAGPLPPQRSQVPVAAPVLLERLQAAGQADGRGPGRRHQQGKIPHAAGLDPFAEPAAIPAAVGTTTLAGRVLLHGATLGG